MHINRYLPVPLLVVLLLSVAVYSQTASFGFVSWDDPNYVIQNTDIHTGITWQSIQSAFTSTRGGMWLPMVWLSYMFDIEMFGLDAGAMHLMNVFYHLINTVLVFIVLFKFTEERWACLVLAGLFALHPLRVESVVWITERKDVLSMMFFLLTLLAYYYYLQKPSLLRYLLLAIGFMFGLMSKPMVVTLPFILLLLDYWPLNRVFKEADPVAKTGKVLNWKVLWEKLPLLLIAASISWATLYYQGETGATHSLSSLPLLDRLANALISYVLYLEKIIVPLNLAFFYPLRTSVDLIGVILSVVILVLISWGSITQRKTRPYLMVGWFWFLGMLFPVSGISQAGLQAMADRFTYIPLIGIFIMLAWGLTDVLQAHKAWQTRISLAVASIVVVFAGITYHQIAFWQSDKTLFTHAVEVTDNNYLAQINLAGVLETEGELDKAEVLAKASLQLKADQEKPYILLAKIALKHRQAEQAIGYLSEALSIHPDQAYAHFLLGNAYLLQRNPQSALRHYLSATQLDTRDWEAYHSLGITYASLGDMQNAIVSFQRALALKPDNSELQLSLALATEQVGNLKEALQLYQQLVQKSPDNVLLYKRLAHLYALQGDNRKALEMSLEVLRRDANDSEANKVVKQLQH